MKQTVFILFLLINCITSNAQSDDLKKVRNEATKTFGEDDWDPIAEPWHAGGSFAITISQGSLSNWAAGGDDFSLSGNCILNYFFQHRYKKFSWDNNLDVNLGYIQTTTLKGQKNDDRFDYVAKLGIAVHKKLNLSTLFSVRTQVFDGYNTSNPSDPQLNSTLFSPAYFIASFGIDYKPFNKFSLFISPIASRSVIILDGDIAKLGLYGVPKTTHETSKTSLGAFATATYNNKLSPNVTYKFKMDAFSNYKKDPLSINVYMTNYFTIKLSKILAITYGLDFIYDPQLAIFGPNGTSPALQVKSMLGLGLNLNLKSKVYK
jgi:Protein of unknown function (DUF3078)